MLQRRSTASSAAVAKRPGSVVVRSVAMARHGPSKKTDQQSKQPRKVAIFVEPSPFSHVSGMKNRFECLIRGLREEGDDVLVVTPDPKAPPEFCGAKVVPVLGFRLPFYASPTLLLSPGLSPRVLLHLARHRPHLLHVSSPGLMVFAATLYAKLLGIPLVVSYHTHIPEYIPKYTWAGLVGPMWAIIRWCTAVSDLTLVTSAAMKDELSRNQCRPQSIDVWQRGVDTTLFHPSHRCPAMRQQLSDGEVDKPLMVYVGRLGAEKNLFVLKEVMQRLPGTRLALVGDGPSRGQLEEHFGGLPVKFMGLLRGEALSQAYASADLFLMPSETETLGFVVLEAMAAGLPVVAVAAGGLTDIITLPGVTGMLYRSGDYEGAAALARQLIEDDGLRARMGAAARREVEQWGWGAATRKIREQQYARAIRVHGSRRRYRPLSLRVGLARLSRLLAGVMALGLAFCAACVGLGLGLPLL